MNSPLYSPSDFPAYLYCISTIILKNKKKLIQELKEIIKKGPTLGPLEKFKFLLLNFS